MPRLLLDQAAWHLLPRLTVPDNVTIVPLPAKCPGAEPAGKHLAVHARQLALQPRASSYDNLVDHCSYAWNQLAEQPWIVMSIGLRDWAHGS